jgi:hypothetical protein
VRSRERGDTGEDVEFGAGESGFNADVAGTGVARADYLTRRRSFEDDNG